MEPKPLRILVISKNFCWRPWYFSNLQNSREKSRWLSIWNTGYSVCRLYILSWTRQLMCLQRLIFIALVVRALSSNHGYGPACDVFFSSLHFFVPCVSSALLSRSFLSSQKSSYCLVSHVGKLSRSDMCKLCSDMCKSNIRSVIYTSHWDRNGYHWIIPLIILLNHIMYRY